MARTALPRWPLKLKARFPNKATPSYREIYQCVVDGLIPSELHGNRLFIDDSHEDQIVEHFGLKDGTAPEQGPAEQPATPVAARTERTKRARFG